MRIYILFYIAGNSPANKEKKDMAITERISADRIIDNRVKLIQNPAPPAAGEKCYSVIPNYKLTSLFNGVLQSPLQIFTASTLWRPADREKYETVILPKLLAEKKVVEVGKIGKNLKPELSDEGRSVLTRFEIQYNL
jgi:hypothetical protein